MSTAETADKRTEEWKPQWAGGRVRQYQECDRWDAYFKPEARGRTD